MKLKSFGCSFIYGSDLADCPHGTGQKHPPPSNLTWPALLASRYGMDYHCHARPASGNLQILETLLSNISDAENTLVIVNWTWIDRFSFIDESEKTSNSPWNPNGWCSLLPGQKQILAETYYRYLHSQFRDKLETLICIKVAIDSLRARDMRFIMTYTDDLTFETQWHTSTAITDLQDFVRPHMSYFNSQSYWQWITAKKFNLSDRWHPLESAHEAAAELMCPVIDTILHRV